MISHIEESRHRIEATSRLDGAAPGHLGIKDPKTLCCVHAGAFCAQTIKQSRPNNQTIKKFYHNHFFLTIPLPKRIKKVVNTTLIPVNANHCFSCDHPRPSIPRHYPLDPLTLPPRPSTPRPLYVTRAWGHPRHPRRTLDANPSTYPSTSSTLPLDPRRPGLKRVSVCD